MRRELIMMSSSVSHRMTVPQWTGRNQQDKPDSAELDTPQRGHPAGGVVLIAIGLMAVNIGVARDGTLATDGLNQAGH